jgi:hypothetical protein
MEENETGIHITVCVQNVEKNMYINLLGSSLKRRTVISEQASYREGKKKGAVHIFALFKVAKSSMIFGGSFPCTRGKGSCYVGQEFSAVEGKMDSALVLGLSIHCWCTTKTAR